MASLRDKWKQAKAEAASYVDMRLLADKSNLGPLLDKFEAERKAYHATMDKMATNPDDAKAKAAKQKVITAADTAMRVGATYMAAIKYALPGHSGATKVAMKELIDVLLLDIYVVLERAKKGYF